MKIVNADDICNKNWEKTAQILISYGADSRLFEDFGYGLQLLLKDGESKSFDISREAIRDPDKFLSNQSINFYKHQEQYKIFN
jgi:hypothetical protein